MVFGALFRCKQLLGSDVTKVTGLPAVRIQKHGRVSFLIRISVSAVVACIPGNDISREQATPLIG